MQIVNLLSSAVVDNVFQKHRRHCVPLRSENMAALPTPLDQRLSAGMYVDRKCRRDRLIVPLFWVSLYHKWPWHSPFNGASISLQIFKELLPPYHRKTWQKLFSRNFIASECLTQCSQLFLWLSGRLNKASRWNGLLWGEEWLWSAIYRTIGPSWIINLSFHSIYLKNRSSVRGSTEVQFCGALQKLQKKHWECQKLQKFIGSDTCLLNPVPSYLLVVSTCIL